MDLKAFGSAIAQIVEEKGISQERVVETIELALAAAYKRDYASRGEHIRVKLDPKKGTMQVFKVFLVLDESMVKPEEEAVKSEGASERESERAREASLSARAAAAEHLREARGEGARKQEGESDAEEGDERVRFNPERHMMEVDAKKIQKDVKPGEELVIEMETHEEFGRIAAQTAKQVIVQRLREVERETIADEYRDKVGEILSGVVQRVEGRTIFVDLGRGVGVLFPQEQIPGEYLRLGARARALLLEVNQTSRGPQILLSRAHPEFVRQLFTLEVPEVATGSVEIKAIAREAGSRTKIAVASNQPGVDPIGACVGQRGTRVLTVINEINGEKIDVIEWSGDTERFIANALAPAKVTSVSLRDRATATVEVPEEQMSLAIGREGQNVRLAVKLTNWKIDIEGAPGIALEEGEGGEAVPEKDGKEEALAENQGAVESAEEDGGAKNDQSPSPNDQ